MSRVLWFENGKAAATHMCSAHQGTFFFQEEIQHRLKSVQWNELNFLNFISWKREVEMSQTVEYKFW